MATTTTIPELKRALLDEIQNLSITSATAAAPTEVQTAYARPPVEQLRSEVVYFSDEMRTIADAEQRLVSGRRKRFNTWEIELVVLSAIISDAESSEQRAFVISAAVENFLAANPQPAEWATTPVASGALYVLVTGFDVRHMEDAEGFRAVEITMLLEAKERLT